MGNSDRISFMKIALAKILDTHEDNSGYFGIFYRHDEKNTRYAKWRPAIEYRKLWNSIEVEIKTANEKGWHVEIMNSTVSSLLPRWRYGGDDDLLYTASIAVDIDDAPAEESIEMLKKSKLKPSLIVSSGSGVHAHWSLKNVIDMRDDDLFMDVKMVRLGVARYFGGDQGLKSPSHKIRMPGTVNVKPSRMVVAKVVYTGNEEYTLSDFAAAGMKAIQQRYISVDIPDDVLRKISEKLSDRADEQVADLAATTQGNRNAVLNAKAWWFGVRAEQLKLSEADVTALLMSACVSNGLVADDGEKSVEASVKSGFRRGTSNSYQNTSTYTTMMSAILRRQHREK